MMENNQSKIDDFVQIVREYCSWAEAAPTDPSNEIRIAKRILSTLHSGILQFPNVQTDSEIEGADVPEAIWKQVLARFRTFPVTHYAVLFDPLRMPPEEPVIGSIADDLADIYRDLKRGLSLYDEGQKSEAGWEWSFHFWCHWGRHLSSAPYVLHCHFEQSSFNED